jgi:hypothetical protein
MVGAEGVGPPSDEPGNPDQRALVAEAWREFAGALAQVLPVLPPGAHLDLALDPVASGTGTAVYQVCVRTLDDGDLEAVAVGNGELPATYRMDRIASGDMIALGWAPPGVLPGSGDRFGLQCVPAKAEQLAAVLTRTLSDIYGAPHPAFLVYLVYDEQDRPIETGPLGTARYEPIPGATFDVDLDAEVADLDVQVAGLGVEVADEDLPLDERVRAVIAEMTRTTVDQLQIDTDGDIGIRAGSAMVFVRVRANPPLVDVFSPILTGVDASEELYQKLCELTNRMPIGRIYWAAETVWASIPVFGRNFQGVHLMLAVQVMTGLADELDDRLHGEFGGRRFFDDDGPEFFGDDTEQAG